MSWPGYGCMGMSRYCEWDPNDRTYRKIKVRGACTSRCTFSCNNYRGYQDTNPSYPDGCYKCFGMFPGFLNKTDPHKADPYAHGMSESGPCTPPETSSTTFGP